MQSQFLGPQRHNPFAHIVYQRAHKGRAALCQLASDHRRRAKPDRTHALAERSREPLLVLRAQQGGYERRHAAAEAVADALHLVPVVVCVSYGV